MDRLKQPKDFLEKLRLTDSDYQDSGMINHIADLLERYHSEQLRLHLVSHQRELLKAYERILLNAGDLTQKIKDRDRDEFIESFNRA